jgi:hypothetical protein
LEKLLVGHQILSLYCIEKLRASITMPYNNIIEHQPYLAGSSQLHYYCWGYFASLQGFYSIQTLSTKPYISVIWNSIIHMRLKDQYYYNFVNMTII